MECVDGEALESVDGLLSDGDGLVDTVDGLLLTAASSHAARFNPFRRLCAFESARAIALSGGSSPQVVTVLVMRG